MPVALTGKLHTSVNNIVKLLANSPNFRTWLGAVDATAAEAFIWVYEKDPDITQTKYAIITASSFGGSTGGNVNRGCIAFKLITGSTFGLFEEKEVSEMDSDAAITFVNMVGEVLDDIMEFQNSTNDLGPIDTIEKNEEIGLRFRDGEKQGYQMEFSESYQQI